MSRSITIGGVERADLTRLESFSFQESAYRGEAGQGGFDVDSEAGAVSVSAWKNVLATDSDGGRFFTGQTVDRGVGRGPFTTDADARWDVQVIDINTIMDDILLRGTDCNRPAETDVQRMQWLITDFLAGVGGFPAIGDDYLSAANAEAMDAQDYRKQGVYPRSVADECAENSGKNWYLFYDVGVTDQLQIWYGREALTTRTSSYSISSVLEDIDDYGVTWPAEWPEESGMQRDPSRVYSGVQIVYGPDNHGAYVTRAGTVTAFKRREAILYDASVKTETSAIKLGEHYLDAAETEDITITVSVTVPTTHVNAFLHGQRIAVRFPHLGYDTPTYMRCRTRTVEPAGEESKAPDRYRVTLVLKPTTKVTSFGGRPIGDVPGQGDNPPPEQTPAETEPVACGTPVVHPLDQQVSPEGDYFQQLGTVSVPGSVGSFVYYNIAYTACGCPIGGGGWVAWSDTAEWFEFTAPADSTSYLGMQVEVDASAVTGSSPFVGSFLIKVAQGAAALGRYGEGTGIGALNVGGVATFYIPRSLISWGATNSIIIEPAWQCVRGAFYCNSVGNFSAPYQDGRGDSSKYEGFDVSDVCAIRFVAGTNGSSGWVAGLGSVNGANDTFTLIDWTGLGTVEASINGLIQPSTEVILDGGAGTATLATPPPAGAIVLFLYTVAA